MENILIAALTTIVDLGEISLHVQTEYVSNKLITLISNNGHVIGKFERDCSSYINKPGFPVKLPKIAAAMQTSAIQRSKQIWIDYLDREAFRISFLEKRKLGTVRSSQEPHPVSSINMTFAANDHINRLIKLALETNEPEVSRLVLLEALEIDPDNPLVNANLAEIERNLIVSSQNGKASRRSFRY